METDIPYKDSMFTVVGESYFTENRWIGPTIDMYNTLKKQINYINNEITEI